MRMLRVALLAATLLPGVAQTQPLPAQPLPAQTLPGTARDLAFDMRMPTVDLEAPHLVFIAKGHKQQGSSVGFHVAETGRRKQGTFVPYNSSSVPEAEVVSYRLARVLGVSHLYNPVTYYELGPQASARFKGLLLKHPEVSDSRRENRARALGELARTPDKLGGIYRERPEGKMYVARVLGREGQPNLAHPLWADIRADRPQPSDAPLSLAGVKGQRPEFPKPAEQESELARQLSSILVIDQLMGQWDRFWNNLEALGDATGRLQLLARDNGGADLHDGWAWHTTYQRLVSRYDRDMMDRLVALNAFLQGRGARAGDFTSIEAWKTAIGFRKPASFATFKRKLGLLVDATLAARLKQYGERVYFVGSSRVTAASPSSVARPQETPRPALPDAPVQATAPTGTTGSVNTGESRGGWRSACVKDVQRFCPRVSGGHDKRRCLDGRISEISAACRASLDAREDERADIKLSCATDLATQCADAIGNKAQFQCLRQKTAQLSASCRQALTEDADGQ